MRFGKKGISAVVAIVLIVLIVVVAATLIWVSVVPTVRNLDVESEDVELDVIGESGFTAYDPVSELATIQVYRSYDNVSILEIDIILSFNGTTVPTRVLAPLPGQLKTYTINVSSYGVPESVTTAVVYPTGEVGPASASEDIPIGTLDNDSSGIIYPAGWSVPSDTGDEEPLLVDNNWCNGADIDKDGDVDIFDFTILQPNYGTMSGMTSTDGDLDGDGDVDVFDWAIFQVQFGRGDCWGV